MNSKTSINWFATAGCFEGIQWELLLIAYSISRNFWGSIHTECLRIYLNIEIHT